MKVRKVAIRYTPPPPPQPAAPPPPLCVLALGSAEDGAAVTPVNAAHNRVKIETPRANETLPVPGPATQQTMHGNNPSTAMLGA